MVKDILAEITDAAAAAVRIDNKSLRFIRFNVDGHVRNLTVF